VNAADILWGVDAIASAINRPVRATYHILEGGHLPAKKVGGRWVANRQSLIDALSAPASPPAPGHT
jgi:hypothetical protein